MPPTTIIAKTKPEDSMSHPHTEGGVRIGRDSVSAIDDGGEASSTDEVGEGEALKVVEINREHISGSFGMGDGIAVEKVWEI